MSSWGNNDNSANAPYWAVNSTITKAAPSVPHAAPTAANVAYLYGNTASGAYITNATIGLFGVSADEATVDGKGAHTGWVLRTVGSGGRAGRVQEETLVALSTMSGDDEDTIYKDTIITITSQPANRNIIAPNATSFAVTATSNPTKSLSYQWQRWTPSFDWANMSNAGVFSGVTTNTLACSDVTGYDTYKFRCVITATGTGASVTSANGNLTVV